MTSALEGVHTVERMLKRRESVFRQDGPAIRRLLLIPALFGAAAVLAVSPARAVLAPIAAVGSGTQGPVRPTFSIVVVEGLTVDQLTALEPLAAVGLLVPGAGPLTDGPAALAGLVRGLNVHASFGRLPHTRPIVSASFAQRLPTAAGTIVVSLPSSGSPVQNDLRYPMAVIGGGFHGLVTSPTTRIPGLVSVADIAPTALGRVHGSLGHVARAGAVESLERLNTQIHANNRLKLPMLIIIAGALLLLMVAWPRAALPAILAALLTSLVAGAVNATNETLLVAMVVLGTIGGGLLLSRICRDDRRLLAAIVLVLVVHVVLLVVHPEWVAVAPLGPTQNSRFWGIGNQLETLLLAPVLAGASLALRRYGAFGFAAFALLALVLVTDNRLGSDGGGAIVFGVALAFVGARAWRLGVRGFTTLLGLSALIVLAVIALNLRLPGPNHLRSAFGSGFSGLVRVVVDRVPLSYLPALHEWPLFVPLALLFVAAFVVGVRAADHRSRELVLAAGLAVATSLLVNDSAVYEVAGGVAVVAALARFRPPVAPQAFGLQPRAALVQED